MIHQADSRKYFHTELIFSEEVFENVKRVLAGKIPMNALNKSQAMVPKDCTVINNPVGSASVSWFEKEGKVLVSMPGVPQEMTTVMTESVLPKLHEKFRTDVIMHRTFQVQHYPESVLAEKLEPWETALRKASSWLSAQTWHYPPAADRTRTKEIRSRKRTESRTSQTGSDTRR